MDASLSSTNSGVYESKRQARSKTQTNKRALIVLGGPGIQKNSRNEWVFEWLLLWQACCDRITHSVEQIGPWVPAGPRGLSTAPRLRLSQRRAAHSMAVAWQTLTVSVMAPVRMQEYCEHTVPRMLMFCLVFFLEIKMWIFPERRGFLLRSILYIHQRCWC